jgi:hypothetical protein
MCKQRSVLPLNGVQSKIPEKFFREEPIGVAEIFRAIQKISQKLLRLRRFCP